MPSSPEKRIEQLEERCAALEQVVNALFRQLTTQEQTKIAKELADLHKRFNNENVATLVNRLIAP